MVARGVRGVILLNGKPLVSHLCPITPMLMKADLIKYNTIKRHEHEEGVGGKRQGCRKKREGRYDKSTSSVCVCARACLCVKLCKNKCI